MTHSVNRHFGQGQINSCLETMFVIHLEKQIVEETKIDVYKLLTYLLNFFFTFFSIFIEYLEIFRS